MTESITSEVCAPAKITWTLTVGERGEDGLHRLVAEMFCVDFADVLRITEPGNGLTITVANGSRAGDLNESSDNLIRKALALAERQASVVLEKNIPLGGGLGGGSSDAAALLRWAGYDDLGGATTLGSDVPFCLVGGRAMVRGIGEHVQSLEDVERHLVLLIPPIHLDTALVYAAFDQLEREGSRTEQRNDLQSAARLVDPDLVKWEALLGSTTGLDPILAGSGSTLFVEGTKEILGLSGVDELALEGVTGLLVETKSVPRSFGDPKKVNQGPQ